MATTSDIQFQVSCPVCFEIYKYPKILRCLHTICSACVDRLTKLSCVRCPQCRVVTKMDEIVNDFKIQTWVDLFVKLKNSKFIAQATPEMSDRNASGKTPEIGFDLDLSSDGGMTQPTAPSASEMDLSLHDYETNIYSSLEQHPDLLSLKHQSFDVQKICSFNDTKGVRIFAIGTDLWVVLDSGRIAVIQREMQSERVSSSLIEIRQECVSVVGFFTGSKSYVKYLPKAVTQMRNGDVIVACDGAKGFYSGWMYKEYGLFHVDVTGLVQHVIARGRYEDVTNNYDFIYSLRAEAPRSLVEVHYYNSKTIQCVTVLHFHVMSPSMRILALPECLYMTSLIGDESEAAAKTALCRQSMTMSTADLSPPLFIQTKPRLESIFLACVDIAGTLLLVDNTGGGLLVMDNKDKMHDLNVKRDVIKAPTDATIVDNDQLFVVATCVRTNKSSVFKCF